MNPEDTIAAVSSPAGSGGRAIIRLSGPRALEIATRLFHAETAIEPSQRRIHTGSFALPGVTARLPGDLYLFPAPRSFTGQLVVELHFISSPPLVELLLSSLFVAGARAANPGEFSLRAFLNGKLDLPRAEAMLGVIEAHDRDELMRSLRQLAGGVSRPLEGLREDLLDLLADLEAGLDFVEEDISFVNSTELLSRLARGLAQVTLVAKQVEDRGLAGRPFRVALAGPPNAGKTSLFNALTGGRGLVSPKPGTTRDYLVARINIEGMLIEVIDTAGLQSPTDAIDDRSQELGRSATADADLILWCSVGGVDHARIKALAIATQCDRVPAPPGWFATSATSEQGVDELKSLLAAHAKRRADSGLASGLSRCRGHVERCLTHLRSAHNSVLFNDPPEVVALELRSALDHIGAMTGAVYTDDLLDRVFGRFCIGK